MSFPYANSVCTFGANPNYTRCFFMNSKEIKEVVLLLNTSQASKNIDNLKNKLEETRRLKEEAFETTKPLRSWGRRKKIERQ